MVANYRRLLVAYCIVYADIVCEMFTLATICLRKLLTKL